LVAGEDTILKLVVERTARRIARIGGSKRHGNHPLPEAPTPSSCHIKARAVSAPEHAR
jgi:hypothetical protein